MKWLLLILTIVLIVIHQDFWNWTNTEPRWFGFLPIGLWYHALFCIAASILLWLFVRTAWPSHLEEAEQLPPQPGARFDP